MKIAVIFTGGTIGCMAKEGWLSTDPSTNFLLIEKYKSLTADNDTVFETSSPCSMLSENLSAAELNLTIKSVIDKISGDCDGVIVTHGTDTLTYTATALSYALSGVKKPVILVSSNYPLDNDKANGVLNFVAAVKFISSANANGVYISYKNDDSNSVSFHIPTSVVLHREGSGDIFSINGIPFAEYLNEELVVNGRVETRATLVDDTEYCEYPPILTIDSRPCDSFSYSLEGIKAVIIKPYHSGTLNSSNSKLYEFCQKANEKHVPVFLVNMPTGMTYESSKMLDDFGLISLPYCTYISTYVKCWLAISKDVDVVDFMKKVICTEYLE